ncbi:hypothetical protein ACU8DI_13120 [Psychroserpens sp. BH13MA-6]
MNIALAGIVILILLLPGILFNKSYFSGEFSSQYTVKDFFGLLTNTLIPSLIIYVIIGIPIVWIIGYQYDFQTLLGLLSSEKDIVEEAISNVELYRLEIISFNSVMCFISFCLGHGFRNLVLNRSLDTRIPFLRFDNIWHYLITGKFIMLRRSQIQLFEDTIQDVDITYVVALVNVAGSPFIYNGALVDYELSKDGGLNLIYLNGAKRKDISNSENEYIDIEGHTIILKYENIINLNLSFIATDLIYDEDGNLSGIDTRLIE